MARGMRAEKVVEWQERFTRFERSGTTITQFCLDEGISTPSFFAWRRKLGRKPAGGSSHSANRFARGTARADQHGGQAGRQGHFVPVRLRGQINVGGPLTTLTAELPSGTRLTIPVSDPEVLREAIAAVIQADAERPGGQTC